MLALLGAVFTASLLGSLHCTGMCGAFIAFAVAGDDANAAPVAKWKLNTAYNLGRLVTYALLGAIAGGVGSAVDLGGDAVGIRDGAAILAGLVMVLFGTVTVLRLGGFRIARLPLPPGLDRVVTRGHRAAMGLTPVRRAAMIGLLTTLLPCGWLYAFAISAAGTADPLLGAVTMAVFWLGTLPLMAALGAGIQKLAGPLRQKVPLATAMLLVCMGLYTVIARFDVPSLARVMDAELHEADHDVIGIPVGSDPSSLPCCHGK
jgi:sulfite exporter TauE/SafE